ncbi:MAG: hypothetical protein ACI8RZ_007028 [Myxococcota bacterium]|jgi:hypothetical protein
MRALALMALLVVGCDGDKPTDDSETALADTTPSDTTPSDTDDPVTDSGDTDTPTDTGTTDTGTTDTGDSGTDDSGIADSNPCEGKTVGIDLGDCATNFALVDADGTTHELYDYAGQVLMLDFSGFT